MLNVGEEIIYKAFVMKMHSLYQNTKIVLNLNIGIIRDIILNEIIRQS
jgi:hypothetical protein